MEEKLNMEEHLKILDVLKTQEKRPAFQFYVERFIVGTSDMTINEIGAYILLLCRQWDKFELPNNTNKLSAIARCSPEIIESLIEKFPIWCDGNRRNIMLETVRNEQYVYRTKKQAAGVIGASKRWKKPVEELSQPIEEPKPTIQQQAQAGVFFYIGMNLHKVKVSDYVRLNFATYIEQWQMKHKDVDIKSVLSLMDDKYSNGYTFNNQNHIRNSFSFCVKELSKPHKKEAANEQKPSASRFNFGS